MSASLPLRRPVLLAGLILLAFAVLVGLGTWQVYRLEWKNDLIDKRRAALAADPVTLEDIEAGIEHGYDVDWLKARARGFYRHDLERYVYALRDGEAGWRVYTPLVLPGDYVVFADRGFVPHGRRDPATRPGSLVAPQGLQSEGERDPADIVGYVRLDAFPETLFTPENRPADNRWYWADLQAMYRSLPARLGEGHGEAARYMPFVLQVARNGEPSATGGLPLRDPIDADLPNRHLGYALTWYGLAIVLVVMAVVLFRQRRKPDSEAS